jgi:integrase
MSNGEMVVRHGQNVDVVHPHPVERNKSANVFAIRANADLADDFVSHLFPDDVKLMAVMAGRNPRHGERNEVLISTIFDGALRESEVLKLRPIDIKQTTDGYELHIYGKGSKPGIVAITASTAQQLTSYAYHAKIQETDRIFNITRSQVFRIVQDAYKRAGIRQPSKLNDRVGAVHILRHSGALARLAVSGNPKSVQAQLRHKSAAMTLRYMKTLTAREGIAIQKQVNPW